MKKTFYSHGKLLLTAEYLVLDGVSALALPTQKGQWLHITENENLNQITWKSVDNTGNTWFETTIELKNNIFIPSHNCSTENPVTNTLIDILTSAKQLNPSFLSIRKGYSIESTLEFHREWGLGSSSTLINNIAQWAKVDAFKLLDASFGGSGYDIACAQQEHPIVYKRTNKKPIITVVDFNPSFKENLFFIYLNKKQDSKASIKHYQSLPIKDFDSAQTKIQAITSTIINCTSLDEFESLIDQHEAIISNIIKTPTVKSNLFSDYTRSIKSLGGWGGDFILVSGTISEMDYFIQKGYTTIIPYSEMVL